MTDYCIECGDADSMNDEGSYVIVSNYKLNIETEVWLCKQCEESQ